MGYSHLISKILIHNKIYVHSASLFTNNANQIYRLMIQKVNKILSIFISLSVIKHLLH